MSDLYAVREKVEEGINWRGEIRVHVDGEERELTVRQLRDPEFFEVMKLIDREELQSLQGDMPEAEMEEYKELQREDELDEDQRERFEELEEELEAKTADVFDKVSEDTFNGIRRCAKYAVEPSEEDKREAFMDRAAQIESEYGIKVETPEDVEPAIQDDIEYVIDNATNFTSFTIGIQALVETVSEEGNSEN